MDSNDKSLTNLITLNVGRKLQKPGKFTPAKRKQFLEHYSKTGNFSQSALNINMSRQSVIEYLQRDPIFKQAFDEVENHFTDNIEEVSLSMSLQPARDGFQDRRLQLMARRPEKYNPKIQVEVDTTIRIDQAPGKAREILGTHSLSNLTETAEFEIIEE